MPFYATLHYFTFTLHYFTFALRPFTVFRHIKVVRLLHLEEWGAVSGRSYTNGTRILIKLCDFGFLKRSLMNIINNSIIVNNIGGLRRDYYIRKSGVPFLAEVIQKIHGYGALTIGKFLTSCPTFVKN